MLGFAQTHQGFALDPPPFEKGGPKLNSLLNAFFARNLMSRQKSLRLSAQAPARYLRSGSSGAPGWLFVTRAHSTRRSRSSSTRI